MTQKKSLYVGKTDRGKPIFLYFCPVAGIGHGQMEGGMKSTDSGGLCRNGHPGSVRRNATDKRKQKGRMIIDNKQSYGSNPDVKTVWDCILSYTDPSARVGRMDVVTGFFSIAALHLLYQELSESNSYRIVLGDIHDMKRDEGFAKVYGSTKPEKCLKS